MATLHLSKLVISTWGSGVPISLVKAGARVRGREPQDGPRLRAEGRENDSDHNIIERNTTNQDFSKLIHSSSITIICIISLTYYYY